MANRPTVIRPEKVAAVEDLADRIGRSQMAVITDYRGLNVAQLAELRRALQGANAEMRVAKNTLARLAVKGTDQEALTPALEGPTAFVFAYGDPVQMAKTLTDTIRVQRLPMRVKNALLGKQLLSPPEISRLAELPSKEVLQAMLVGTLNAPLAGVVGVLNGVLQQLVGTLEARNEQLGENAA